jgi:hypothetical protein
MKLFHCIVVMGAAMGEGCGGLEGISNGVEGGVDASPPEANAGVDAARSLFGDAACPFAGCYSTCTGTAAAPVSAQDCPQPQQLKCDADTCTCDPTAPLEAGDCPQSGQFVCDDWATACSCRCNLDAGVDPVACCGDAAPALDAQAPCSNPTTRQTWSCYSYDPPAGCDCTFVVPIL